MKRFLAISLFGCSFNAFAMDYTCSTPAHVDPSMRVEMIFDSSGGGLTAAWVTEGQSTCDAQDRDYIHPNTKEKLYDYGGQRLAIGLFCEKYINTAARPIEPFQIFATKSSSQATSLEGLLYRESKTIPLICKETR